jgi:RHS repeat-associated protein
MASYSYDAFNRRITKAAGGATEETAWAGWQPLERYEAGQLAERRTYGPGLDEIVRLESDLDGDGTLEQSYAPLYDHTGNLALAADSATGQIVERYRFDPYGERTILVDSTPPEVEQLRVKTGELWLEVSEGVQAEALQDSLVAGAVTLTDTATSTAVPLTAAQPIQEGRQAFRRIVLTPETPPTEGTTLEIRIEPAALRDAFGNQLAVPYVQIFAWPTADQVLDDTAAPRIEAVRLVDRFVELEITEEPDLATVTSAVRVDGQSLTWTLAADRYTVSSTDALAADGATLSVATTLADRAGTALDQALSESIPATEPDASLFQAQDPRESFASTIVNRAGFQGLDHDPATGLLYVRNRWLDPELGRFLTPDPMNYSDAPSPYQAFLNNGLNFSDPSGLTVRTGADELDIFRFIVRRLGYGGLASTLRLEGGQIEIEKSRLVDWKKSIEGSRTLRFIYKVLMAQKVIVELSFVSDPSLGDYAGGITEPVSINQGNLYHFRTRIDPSILADSALQLSIGDLSGGLFDPRLSFLEGWEPIPLDVAVVHELAHALGAFELKLVSTHYLPGFEGSATNQYAVDREDEYREFLGMTLRLQHEVPALYCPGGNWGSELCKQKMWCKTRGAIDTDTPNCRNQWLEFKKRVKIPDQ